MEESEAIKIKGLEIQMVNNTKKLDDIDKKLDRNFDTFNKRIDQIERDKVSNAELDQRLNTIITDKITVLEKDMNSFKKKLTVTPVITFICGAIIAPLLLYLIVEYFKTH
jgi:hypothetical protein